MPQLTFAKDICPKRISVGLVWDQLEDLWSLEVFMYSQAGTLQETFYSRLPNEFNTIDLCMTIERAFEDWIDVTPGYTKAMLAKSVKRLRPVEVASGLDPREDQPTHSPDGRRRQRSPLRTFPPEIS